jgi:hypothetical protein
MYALNSTKFFRVADDLSQTTLRQEVAQVIVRANARIALWKNCRQRLYLFGLGAITRSRPQDARARYQAAISQFPPKRPRHLKSALFIERYCASNCTTAHPRKLSRFCVSTFHNAKFRLKSGINRMRVIVQEPGNTNPATCDINTSYLTNAAIQFAPFTRQDMDSIACHR